MMNKNLPVFLLNELKEQGLPNDFIDDLLKKSCEVMILAKMYQCKWDPGSQFLTTEEEVSCAAITKAFEGAVWFKDEFGLLTQNYGLCHRPWHFGRKHSSLNVAIC
jgi:hypothetical protein